MEGLLIFKERISSDIALNSLLEVHKLKRLGWDGAGCGPWTLSMARTGWWGWWCCGGFTNLPIHVFKISYPEKIAIVQ